MNPLTAGSDRVDTNDQKPAPAQTLPRREALEFAYQEPDPRHWYASNLIGIAAKELASVRFNEQPVALTIAAARATHRGLFTLLAQTTSLEEAAEVFAHYMSVAFSLGKLARDASAGERRAARSSYLKLLQGWGFDASGPQGAVLKGWVESRFGIVPTFHGGPLERFPSPAWLRYLEEKLGSRFHNNCIYLQLDALYEYCQWSIARFKAIGPRHVHLYRGTLPSELTFLEGSAQARRGVVRLNNLVSFSMSRERAEEFGDWIVESDVPCAKVLFYPGLVPNRVLNGEGEVLVIGGDFPVQVAYA